MKTLPMFTEDLIAAHKQSHSTEELIIDIDFLSDEEPDDRGAHLLFFAGLQELIDQYPKVKFRANFWPGKGNTAIKQATLEKFKTVAPNCGEIIIRQGYHSTSGFEAEGQAYLDQTEIDEVKDKQDSHEQVTQAFIEHMRSNNSRPHYIICTKAPTELMDIQSKESELFKNSYLAISGGNNFREVSKDQNGIRSLLKGFKAVLDYESIYNSNQYCKSFTEHDFPELFAALANIEINTRKPMLEHIQNWNIYIGQHNLKYFCDIIDTDKTISEEERNALKKAVSTAYKNGWTVASKKIIKNNVKLDPYIEAQYEKKKNAFEAEYQKEKDNNLLFSLSLEDFLKAKKDDIAKEEQFNLDRRIGTWQILTEKGLSFLSVDEGLLMFILGYNDHLCAIPGKFNVNKISTGGKVICPLSSSEEMPTVHAIVPAVSCTTWEDFSQNHEEFLRKIERLENADLAYAGVSENSDLAPRLREEKNQALAELKADPLAQAQQHSLRVTGDKITLAAQRCCSMIISKLSRH